MTASSAVTLSRVAAAALVVGATFGLAGTLVTSPELQASLWAVDGVGLVVGTSLLTLKYFRAGSEVAAAGFLVIAIGEGVLLSGTAAGPEGSVPAFAAGTALWAAALALIKCGATVPKLAAHTRRDRRRFVCDDGRPDLLGRRALADLLAAAVLGLSIPRGDLARLGMEPGPQGGE